MKTKVSKTYAKDDNLPYTTVYIERLDGDYDFIATFNEEFEDFSTLINLLIHILTLIGGEVLILQSENNEVPLIWNGE